MNNVTKTQDELYQEFLQETSALRTELEGKVQLLHREFNEFKEPHELEFEKAISPIKEQFLPEVHEIEKKHRYACHNVALVAHRAIDKLDKKRDRKLKPYQERFNKHPDVIAAQDALKAAVDERANALNEEVERLTQEFNVKNGPAHEAYLAKAKALEDLELAALEAHNTQMQTDTTNHGDSLV